MSDDELLPRVRALRREGYSPKPPFLQGPQDDPERILATLERSTGGDDDFQFIVEAA